MDNKYLVGHGDEAKFRLSLDYGKHALNLLFDKLDAGTTITVEQFISEFCNPMKTGRAVGESAARPLWIGGM